MPPGGRRLAGAGAGGGPVGPFKPPSEILAGANKIVLDRQLLRAAVSARRARQQRAGPAGPVELRRVWRVLWLPAAAAIDPDCRDPVAPHLPAPHITSARAAGQARQPAAAVPGPQRPGPAVPPPPPPHLRLSCRPASAARHHAWPAWARSPRCCSGLLPRPTLAPAHHHPAVGPFPFRSPPEPRNLSTPVRHLNSARSREPVRTSTTNRLRLPHGSSATSRHLPACRRPPPTAHAPLYYSAACFQIQLTLA